MFKGKAGSLKYLQDLGLNVPQWSLLKHAEIMSWGNKDLGKELLIL